MSPAAVQCPKKGRAKRKGGAHEEKHIQKVTDIKMLLINSHGYYEIHVPNSSSKVQISASEFFS